MTVTGQHDDPFGGLAALPDGVVLPEIGPGLWNAREDLDLLLPWVLLLVDATGLPGWYDEQIDIEKRSNPSTKDGRNRQVTTRAVIVAWFVLKITRRPLTHTEVGRFLLHNLNGERRALLGIGPVVPDPTGQSPLSRSLLDKRAATARVGRLVKWMNLVVDPSEYDQPRSRVHPDQKETLRRDISAADLEAARERLDWVVTQIMAAPIKAMPRRLRRQWGGGAAVDDTHLPVAARKATRTKVSFDIDSGEYRRTKPTGDRHAPKAKGGKGAKVQEVTKSVQALDLALIVACDATRGDNQYFPTIPLGFAAHAPSTDPGGNAVRVLRQLDAAGVRKGHLAQDRLYPHQKVENWHQHLLDLGWSPIFDYRIDALGRQGFTKDGALLVEGDFHCPMTPDTLVEATLDLRNGKIDHETYRARLKEREMYRLHQKEAADENGTIRRGCPATGNAPKCRCELQPDSLQPHVVRQPDNTDGDTRPLVQLLPTRFADVEAVKAEAAGKTKKQVDKARDAGQSVIPRLCSARTSVSIRADVLLKHRQPLLYGSAEHAETMRSLRNSQEGKHGFAKDDAEEALGRPGTRRKRGLAAQSIYAAVNFAVACLRKIVSFLEHMRQGDDGRFYVPREPRDPGKTGTALGSTGGYQDDEDYAPPD